MVTYNPIYNGITIVPMLALPGKLTDYMKELQALPPLRPLEIKTSMLDEWNEPKKLALNRIVEAAMVYTRGQLRLKPCVACVLGYGPFPYCVHVEGVAMGDCGSCRWRNEGTHCTLHKNNHGVINERGWDRVSKILVQDYYVHHAPRLHREWLDIKLSCPESDYTHHLIRMAKEAIRRIDPDDRVISAFFPSPNDKAELAWYNGDVDFTGGLPFKIEQCVLKLTDMVECDPTGAGKAVYVINDEDLHVLLLKEYQEALDILESHPSFIMLDEARKVIGIAKPVDRKALARAVLWKMRSRRFTYLVCLALKSKFGWTEAHLVSDLKGRENEKLLWLRESSREGTVEECDEHNVSVAADLGLY